MKNKILFALFGLALAVFVHSYLTYEFYPLHFGFKTGQSLCNINAKFDCDAVSASSYSNIAGVPLALFGAVYNGILFLVILLSWWGLRDHSEAGWRDALWLAIGSVMASVVMAGISIFKLNSFCLFCIAAYFLSVFVFVFVYLATREQKPFQYWRDDLLAYLTHRKGFLVVLGFIPFAAIIVHTGLTQSYGADNLEKSVINPALSSWRSEEVNTWSVAPLLSKGATPEAARMVIAEFADFLCGHCKHASPSLDAFVNSHSDVRLLYFAFPLDGQCNPAINQVSGLSCRLARLTYCAERQSLGWQVHHLIYENQSTFFSAEKPESIDARLKSLGGNLKANWDEMSACASLPETEEIIRGQAKLGTSAKVKATPMIFVNGRLLERGQLIPVLEAVHRSL